jgi:hypothetical protein
MFIFSRWTTSKLGCYLSGFVMYFTGCCECHLMCMISVDRYFTLKNPYQKIRKCKLILLVTICFLLSLFWASMPLLGWSNYTLEDNKIACCVDYKTRNLNVISYNVCMFVFVFGIPFSLIIISNIKSLLMVNIALLF